MKLISSYIRGSLLDDLDDLIDASDSSIGRFQTIGNDYIVDTVNLKGSVQYFCNTFDKKAMKTCVENLYWGNEEINVYDSFLRIIENKPIMDMVGCMCNIILSGDKDKIYDVEYIKSLFKPVVKSDTWFNHLIVRIVTFNTIDNIVIGISSELAPGCPIASICLKKR